MSRAITRRELFADGIRELACLAGAAALSSSALRLAFGAEENRGDILVVIFLRGACDGLNLVVPLEGPDRAAYESARPNIKVPVSGDKAALKLDDRFGLHPAGAPLLDLYKAGKLAIVHAAGLPSDTRSHFDAQAYMELGTPGVKSTTNGWLTRHLMTSTGMRDKAPSFLAAVSLGNLTPYSLLAYPEVAVINSLDGFNLAGNKALWSAQRDVLRRLYRGGGWIDRYGAETLDAIDAFENASAPSGGADYPKGEIGNRLKTLAQLIRMDLGLRVAAIDMGGWDTHKYEGEGGQGFLNNHFGQLSAALASFYQDMTAVSKRLTVVVMSEFGRRLKENASRGTDHGHGNIMLVLGDAVAGGKVYGKWPGLSNEELFDRADLAVTTDYRAVLCEILSKRLGNSKLASVFPGFAVSQSLDLLKAG